VYQRRLKKTVEGSQIMSDSNSKRGEITVDTMGKVHNPDGDGVPAVSTAVSAARRKHAQRQNNEPDPEEAPRHHATNDHETQVKEEGSARRNITRKTNNGVDVGKYDAARKRMGGAGKGKWTQAMDGSDTLPITNLDVNDPLYDEETLEGAVLVSAQSNNEDDGVANGTKVYDPVADRIVYGPKFTRAEFKIRVTDVRFGLYIHLPGNKFS